MRILYILRHRFRSLFRRYRAETEMQRELDLHLEQLTKERISAGVHPVEARPAARREFGSLELTKDQCRDMRKVNFVEDLEKDLVYAIRVLLKSPGFTLTAILSLALGIGASTAIFSLVDTVLLRMLPVREPQQLVELTRPGGGTVSYPFFEAIRDRNQVFSGVLLLSAGRMAASATSGGADLGDIHYSAVSGAYFGVLGVSPVIGRALTEADLDSANSAVISYGFWQRAFAGDRDVLGKPLQMVDRAYRIVGVAAPRFTGVAIGQPVDLWVPVARSRNPDAMMSLAAQLLCQKFHIRIHRAFRDPRLSSREEEGCCVHGPQGIAGAGGGRHRVWARCYASIGAAGREPVIRGARV